MDSPRNDAQRESELARQDALLNDQLSLLLELADRLGYVSEITPSLASGTDKVIQESNHITVLNERIARNNEFIRNIRNGLVI